MYRLFHVFMTLCILASSFLLARKCAALAAPEQKKAPGTVVIDAGHGGNDPGKVGIHGELEKDINLAITRKLKNQLEKTGIKVALTRSEDVCLAPEGSASKKRADLEERIRRIEDAGAALTISIHQNSFSDSSASGPQVFFYSGSGEGQQIASTLQNRLNKDLTPSRPRSIKANDSYYLLKKSASPAVIIECGFLSNATEADKLTDPGYQDQIAKSISGGIEEYLSGK